MEGSKSSGDPTGLRFIAQSWTFPLACALSRHWGPGRRLVVLMPSVDSMQVEQEPDQRENLEKTEAPSACRSAARTRPGCFLIASHRGPTRHSSLLLAARRSASRCGQVPSPSLALDWGPRILPRSKSEVKIGRVCGHAAQQTPASIRRPNQPPGLGSRDSLAANCVYGRNPKIGIGKNLGGKGRKGGKKGGGPNRCANGRHTRRDRLAS